MSSNQIISCENLIKIYKTKATEVVALNGLDLQVDEGELLAVIGSSGSGKSTLLNILGGLDVPTVGKAHVAGYDLLKATEKQLDRYKNDIVGFVWQNNGRNLIPYLTACENVELPMRINGKPVNRQRALELLEIVGLKDKKDSRLHELSGGEQQRVAIAISLSNHPKILLADEPTGAVDSKTAASLMALFRRLNTECGLTVIIVTHDMQLSRMVGRVVAIRDGRTSSEFIMKNSYRQEFETLCEMIRSDSGVETHEELVVIDKAGRLQIPKEHLEMLNLGVGNKVRVEFENGRVILSKPIE